MYDFKAAHMMNNSATPTFVKEGSTTDCKDTLRDEIEVWATHHRDIDNCKDGIISELDGNDNVRKS